MRDLNSRLFRPNNVPHFFCQICADTVLVSPRAAQLGIHILLRKIRSSAPPLRDLKDTLLRDRTRRKKPSTRWESTWPQELYFTGVCSTAVLRLQHNYSPHELTPSVKPNPTWFVHEADGRLDEVAAQFFVLRGLRGRVLIVWNIEWK